MVDCAVDVRGISKRYKLGARQKGYLTFRESITEWMRSPLARIRARGRSAAGGDDHVWALKDITFDIAHGDVVGVIGRNGAGKSTLLKVLSRITEPSEGSVDLYGRVGSLLEVGTGFHPEMTGRENIYLSGSILGMKAKEIRRQFDEIVAFAEVEKFIDTQVKHYSSGMYLRLAFAVAAYLEPDILLVDEVLAVGDAAFQKKCLGKMGDLTSSHRTVVFVSHNMAAVSQICNKGILIERGRVKTMGPVADVIAAYNRDITANSDEERRFAPKPDRSVNISRLCLRDQRGATTVKFGNGDPITFEIDLLVHKPLRGDHVFILLERSDGLLVLKASDDDAGKVLEDIKEPGEYRAWATFPGGLLNEGIYQYRVVVGKRRGEQHDTQDGVPFEIEDQNDYTNSCFGKRNGVLLLPMRWKEERLS
jgi:lipopolysaccharide transport system ATP-binding protein